MLWARVSPGLIKLSININAYVFAYICVQMNGRRRGGRTACKQRDESHASKCNCLWRLASYTVACWGAFSGSPYEEKSVWLHNPRPRWWRKTKDLDSPFKMKHFGHKQIEWNQFPDPFTNSPKFVPCCHKLVWVGGSRGRGWGPDTQPPLSNGCTAAGCRGKRVGRAAPEHKQ